MSFGQVQRRIQNWLDRFFPEYSHVFKDWEGKASLITLSEFPKYELFSRQLEEIMAQVETLLAQIPGTNEMLTVPGIGVVTLAGFLAEVGDRSGYDHGQQIIRLAGLNLKENSSGQKKGKSTITKRGRSRLRALLFRAVMPMVSKNAEFKALHHYFTQRSHNPLKKKRSIVALCGKLPLERQNEGM